MSENLASQPQLRQPLPEWCAWWQVCGRLSRTCTHRHIPTHGSVEAKKYVSANTAVTSPVSCDHEHGHKASTQDRETHIICCRSAVTVHVNGQMSAVVAAKTLGEHSITSMTPASPPPVTRLHAWSSRVQTPSLHGHVRLPLRVRKKPSRALRHRRTASCADTHVGQLQKFTLALCMHLLT